MGHSDTHAQLHRHFNDRQFDRIIEHCAPEFMYEDLPRALTIKSPDEFADYLGSWTATFSDATVGSAQYFEGADHSVARFHARGLNDGPVEGMPATGRAIDVPFCEVLHWGSDGKLLSGELYYDQVTLLGQLGVMEQLSEDVGGPSPGDVVRKLLLSFDALDFDAIDSITSDDVQGVDELSRSWLRGREGLQTYFEQIAPGLSEVSTDISDLTERISGNTAVVTCMMEQGYTAGGEREQITAPATVCLRREAGDWRITLIHAVALPPE